MKKKQVIKKEKGPAPRPPSLPNTTAVTAAQSPKELADEKPDPIHKIADENETENKPNRNEIHEATLNTTVQDALNQSEVCVTRTSH